MNDYKANVSGKRTLAISALGGGGLSSCTNVACCDECVYDSTLGCFCHDISLECMVSGQSPQCGANIP